MDSFYSFLKTITLSAIADWLSIAGFASTIWVLITVRSLKRHYVFRARVPVSSKELGASASDLSSLLNDYLSNVEAVRRTIDKIEVLLGSSKTKLDGSSASRAKTALKACKDYGRAPSEEGARRVYRLVAQTIEDIRLQLEDSEWDR